MVYTKISFEWDDPKNRSNLEKHGVSFEEATLAFDDPDAKIYEDTHHSTAHEIRQKLIGRSFLGLLLVIFTIRSREGRYRIISARLANRKERRIYEETQN